MKSDVRALIALCLIALPLTACDTAKEQLNLNRKPPDEFAVVKRAPLSMPPDYTLRPPRPGAPRPQEMAVTDEARQTVFGAEPARPDVSSSGTDALLSRARATSADPVIREIIDQETAVMAPREKPVSQRLLGIGDDEEPAASVVDARAEAERLKQNEAQGKPVTAGETPSIEQ